MKTQTNRRGFMKGLACTGIALATPSIIASDDRYDLRDCAREVARMMNTAMKLNTDDFKSVVHNIVQSFARRHDCITAFSTACYGDDPIYRHVFVSARHYGKLDWTADHIEWDGNQFVTLDCGVMYRLMGHAPYPEMPFEDNPSISGFKAFNPRVDG